jgi:hypothetical protein
VPRKKRKKERKKKHYGYTQWINDMSNGFRVPKEEEEKKNPKERLNPKPIKKRKQNPITFDFFLLTKQSRNRNQTYVYIYIYIVLHRRARKKENRLIVIIDANKKGGGALEEDGWSDSFHSSRNRADLSQSDFLLFPFSSRIPADDLNRNSRRRDDFRGRRS